MSKHKVNFDEYTDNYNSLLWESTGFFSESDAYFARYKVDILRREVPETAKRLLEYGCGIGRNIPFLRAAFPDATIAGSDISVASLEIACKENPGIDFFVEHTNTVPAEPYEVIFIAGVFHHIPVAQRAPVMNTLYRQLAPGRTIVNDCPYDRDAVLLKPSELKSRLTSAGLLVHRSAYCLFVPPSFSALLPLEEKLGWLPLGGQYWVKAKRST